MFRAEDNCADCETLKALLEQAREGLGKAVKRQGFVNEELINARETLAAINAATGEK